MKRARDRFGHFLAAGCTPVIILQACINIAVATSLVPNKGLPLPFISYGGSSLLAMFICVGLLGSVARHGTSSTGPRDLVCDFVPEDNRRDCDQRKQHHGSKHARLFWV
jgi:hypothetical protein